MSTPASKFVPDGSMDDLVEQVVMQVGGCRKTQKLDCEGGDETQRDSSPTQDDEDQQVEGDYHSL